MHAEMSYVVRSHFRTSSGIADRSTGMLAASAYHPIQRLATGPPCRSRHCSPCVARGLLGGSLNVQSLQPFQLERYLAKHEFSAPYLLCLSDCEPLTLAEVLETADIDSRHRWEHLSLGYTESPGLPALREEISKAYTAIKSDDIIVLAPEEGIFLTLNALLQPGDHVVVTYPGYQTLYEVARSVGCKLSYWQPRLSPDSSTWAFDIQELQQLVQPSTKAVIVNFPHNPTGAHLSKSDWHQLCTCCREHSAYLFSDEMYRLLEHDASDLLPSAADSYERGISLSGMSKALSMPGLRIGWVAIQDQELLQKVLQLKDYTTICSSAPSEVLALMGLRNRDATLKRNMDIVQHNLALLQTFFQKHAEQMQWCVPSGSSVAFPKLISGESVDDFCQRCIDEAGVLLLPGSQFDAGTSSPFPQSFRVGYGRKSLPECLERLDSYLCGVS